MPPKLTLSTKQKPNDNKVEASASSEIIKAPAGVRVIKADVSIKITEGFNSKSINFGAEIDLFSEEHGDPDEEALKLIAWCKGIAIDSVNNLSLNK